MSAPPSFSVRPMGESALLVTLGEAIDPLVAARARAIAAAVDAEIRLGRAVAAYASVLVPFDPIELSVEEATLIVEAVIEATPAPADGTGTGRLIEDALEGGDHIGGA